MTASLSRALGRRDRPWLRHPAQVVVVAFALAILVGAALLMLPLARTGPDGAPFIVALFTSTSAVCVTGLVIVDTPSYWSTFGEVVILALIQVGGFGIMTLASLLGLLVFRRLGLRSRLTAATETKATGLGDVGTVVRGVVVISLLFEAVVAALLTLRFAWGYDEEWGHAVYLGVFHAVSAFDFTYATPSTVLRKGAEIIVSGPRDKVERFSALGDHGGAGPQTERRNLGPAW